MDKNRFYELDEENIDQWIQDAMEGAFSTDVSTLADAAVNAMFDQTKQLMVTIVDYKELLMMYACAMKAIQTKFEILNNEFKIRHRRNPINSISTRLKRTASITDKLEKRGISFSLQNIEEHINDVAGVRVICSYIDDIYTIAEALLKQDDITLIERKDYITDPKPNGYRSLHLIIKIPVYFAQQRKDIKVEVQIRTIAMDFWASLEHQLKYKQVLSNHQDIAAELKACADTISATDERMLNIRKQIEAASDALSEEDILFEKISKLDISLS